MGDSLTARVKMQHEPAAEVEGECSAPTAQVYFIQINFFKIPNKYTAILLYLFFDFLLSIRPKKIETEK